MIIEPSINPQWLVALAVAGTWLLMIYIWSGGGDDE